MKFTDALTELGIPFVEEGHHHCRTGWVQLDCPFCGKESQKYHLGYNIDRNYMHCWRCGPKTIVSVLMEASGLPFRKCTGVLKGIETTYPEKKLKIVRKVKLPKGIGELLPCHIKYLRDRGFNPTSLIQLWDIKGIGIASRLPWRIFIPILHNRKVVSWTTRAISRNNLVIRYISASEEEEALPHKSLLYGEDYVGRSVIIHEGPIDVWATGPGAVAVMGTSYTSEQTLRLSKYPRRVVCFDNDRQAQTRAKSLCDLLFPFPGETLNVQLDSKDAGSASEKELRKLRKLL